MQTAHFEYIRTTNSIWPNQLLNLNTSESNIETTLDVIEKKSGEGKIPNLLMLNPTTQMGTWIEKIRRRKYKSSVWYAMTHDLEHITLHNTTSDFRTIQVENKNDFKEWLLLVEEVLMGSKSLNPAVFTELLENSSCYFFMGLEGNQPVSTAFLFVDGKSAGVYLVATKKSHRRKGFGIAMTNRCLLTAKERNCDNVELQATELGKGVYEALGFKGCGAIDVFTIKSNDHFNTLGPIT